MQTPPIDELRKLPRDELIKHLETRDIGLSHHDWCYLDIPSKYKHCFTRVVSTKTIKRHSGNWDLVSLLSREDTDIGPVLDQYPSRYSKTISQAVPLSYVREHPNYEWNRVGLSQNPEITLNDVFTLELPNATEDWDYTALSEVLPLDEIRAHPEIKWSKKVIVLNPGYTTSDMDLAL